MGKEFGHLGTDTDGQPGRTGVTAMKLFKIYYGIILLYYIVRSEVLSSGPEHEKPSVANLRVGWRGRENIGGTLC